MYPMYAEPIKLKPLSEPNDNSKPKNFFFNRKHFKKSHVTQIKTGLCSCLFKFFRLKKDLLASTCPVLLLSSF